MPTLPVNLMDCGCDSVHQHLCEKVTTILHCVCFHRNNSNSHRTCKRWKLCLSCMSLSNWWGHDYSKGWGGGCPWGCLFPKKETYRFFLNLQWKLSCFHFRSCEQKQLGKVCWFFPAQWETDASLLHSYSTVAKGFSDFTRWVPRACCKAWSNF